MGNQLIKGASSKRDMVTAWSTVGDEVLVAAQRHVPAANLAIRLVCS